MFTGQGINTLQYIQIIINYIKHYDMLWDTDHNKFRLNRADVYVWQTLRIQIPINNLYKLKI